MLKNSILSDSGLKPTTTFFCQPTMNYWPEQQNYLAFVVNAYQYDTIDCVFLSHKSLE